MPTDLEQQLPRFAEALDREAPPISVDEILSRGTVAVDVDRLERPAWDQVPRLAAVSWGDAMPGHGENGERDALIELGPRRRPTAGPSPCRARRSRSGPRRPLCWSSPSRRSCGSMTNPTLPTCRRRRSPPRRPPFRSDPFVGVWLSTDTDGSSQTMEIARSGTDEYEVVIRDEAATAACAGGASTLTGAGRLATDTSLVIAQPELTCDDGTTPPIGPPPQAELANFTLDLDTATGELVDSFGVVWQREGSNVDLRPSPVPLRRHTVEPPTSGGMWPQSTLEEVRAAQELADAGDPDYTWQVGPQLTEDDPWWRTSTNSSSSTGSSVRCWAGRRTCSTHGKAGTSTTIGGTDGWVDGALTDQRYLRCAPGRTNPLYPPQPDSEQPGESCAPTLDDLRYESVSLDLAQLDRQGRDGIWVVNRWRLTAPFAQADPAAVEAQATERLEEFLAARIAGTGAEGHVQVDPDIDVPLLYATTSGAPYERYEIERVDGPQWPNGRMTFSARLFADGDATVVEQEIRWDRTEWRVVAGCQCDDRERPAGRLVLHLLRR